MACRWPPGPRPCLLHLDCRVLRLLGYNQRWDVVKEMFAPQGNPRSPWERWEHL